MPILDLLRETTSKNSGTPIGGVSENNYDAPIHESYNFILFQSRAKNVEIIS